MAQRIPERRSARPERSEPLGDLEEAAERMRRMSDATFDGFGVEAEPPSVKREDINIDLVGNDLQNTGEIKQEERTGTLRPTRRSRSAGRSSSDPDQDATAHQLAWRLRWAVSRLHRRFHQLARTVAAALA